MTVTRPLTPGDADTVAELLRLNRDFLAPSEPVRDEEYYTADGQRAVIEGPPVAIELRTAGRPAVIEVSGGSVRTRLGTTPAPDLVLRGTPQLMLGLISTHLTPRPGKGRWPGG
jgi:hypothetical protein